MTQPVDIDPLVFAAVLAAAAMHAGWSALLKLRLEPFLSIAHRLGCIASFPLMWAHGGLSPSRYGSNLSDCRRHRPAADGISLPRISGGANRHVAASGAAILATGVVLISLLSGSHRLAPLDPGALAFALLTSLAISGSTLVDGIGARVAGDAQAYSASLFVLR